MIGGAILAAVAIAVVAFLALGGDDDGSSDEASNESTDASDEDNSTDDGGEEDLEDLEDACADGDFGVCDDLYFAAELGSELEEFGSTCGGIAEPQEGFCETTNGGEDEPPDGTRTGPRMGSPAATSRTSSPTRTRRRSGSARRRRSAWPSRSPVPSKTASSTRSRR